MGFPKVAKSIIKLIYPPSCHACGAHLVQGEQIVCLHCQHDLFAEEILVTDKDILSRLWGRVEIKQQFNLMSYKKGNRAQKLIYNYKYAGYTTIGTYLGKLTAKKIKKTPYKFDLVIAVPLHSKKLKKRGFNQSELFAQAIANHLDIPYTNTIMTREKNSETQTRKSRIKRWENVEEIFKVVSGTELTGKKVLLIDDILTTGATIESVGKILEEHQIRSLSICTMAIADR